MDPTATYHQTPAGTGGDCNQRQTLQMELLSSKSQNGLWEALICLCRDTAAQSLWPQCALIARIWEGTGVLCSSNTCSNSTKLSVSPSPSSLPLCTAKLQRFHCQGDLSRGQGSICLIAWVGMRGRWCIWNREENFWPWACGYLLRQTSHQFQDGPEWKP